MAELALILPVFVMLVMGQIESARLGMVAQLLTNAARDACRVAAMNNPNATTSDIQSQVATDLNNTGISMSSVTVNTTANFNTAAYQTPITVTVSVPFSAVSWFPTPYFLKTAVVTGTATMIKEG